MRFTLSILFISLYLSNSAYGQNSIVPKDAAIHNYRNQLLAYMRDDTMASLSVSVLIDGKVKWSEAFGYADAKNKILADTNTIYRIGSITKPITAFLMMQMIERGYFKLNDTVENYLPEIKRLIGYSDSSKITFEQLATHTSGLPFEPGLEGAALGPIDHWEEILLAAIPVTSVSFKPGTKVSYSNFGFGILGLAISRAVGKPYIELVQQNIFDPLKMTSTFFILPENKFCKLAVGTLKESFEQYKDIPLLEQKGRGYKVPVGGVYSTPNDYARFVQALMGISGTKVLSDKNCELMKTKGIGMGVGVVSNNFIIVGHGGSNVGYTSSFAFDKGNNNGVIIMRNYFPEYEYRNYTKGFLEQLRNNEL